MQLFEMFSYQKLFFRFGEGDRIFSPSKRGHTKYVLAGVEVGRGGRYEKRTL